MARLPARQMNPPPGTPPPKGWLTLREFAQRLNRAENVVRKGLEEGKVSTRAMLYWRSPNNGQPMLIVDEAAIEQYEQNCNPKNIHHKSKSVLSAKLEKKRRADLAAAKEQDKLLAEIEGCEVDDFDDTEQSKGIDNMTPEEIQNISLTEAKRLREIVKMQKEQMELMKARNELIEYEHIESLIKDMAINIKQNLNAIAPRIGPIIAAETDAHTVVAMLQAEIDQTLTNILDPESFKHA